MSKKKLVYLMICFLFLMGAYSDSSFAESDENQTITQANVKREGYWEKLPIELNSIGTLTIYANQEHLELPEIKTATFFENGKEKELVLDKINGIKAIDVKKIKFVGEKGQLYLPEDARYLFASERPKGITAFKNVSEIEGLEVLNLSKTKKIAHLFDNLQALEHLVFPADFSVADTTDGIELLNGLTHLKTLILPDRFPVDDFNLLSEQFKGMKDLEMLKLPKTIKSKYSLKEIQSWLVDNSKLKSLLIGEEIQPLVMSESKKKPVSFKAEHQKDNGTYWGSVPVQMANGVLVIQSPRNEEIENYLGHPNSDGTLDNKHSIKASDVTMMFFSNAIDKVKLPEDSSYLFATTYGGKPWFEKLSMLVDLDRLDTSGVTDMTGLFSGQKQLTSLNLSRMKTGDTIYMAEMFKDMTGLNDITLPETFETRQAVNINGMFSGMTNLQSLVLPDSFKITGTHQMVNLFKGNTGLKTLHFGNDFYFNAGIASALPALPMNETFTGGWKSSKHRFKSSAEMMKKVIQPGFGGTYYREEVEQGLKIPDKLIFKNGVSGVYKPQLLGRKDTDWKITVFDNSPGTKEWHVSARLKEPFTANTIKNRSAEDILVYKKTKESIPLVLTEEMLPIADVSQATPLENEIEYDINWQDNTGLILDISRLESLGLANDSYKGMLEFTLMDAD
ncbi:BspA family leucine-rich repeat surface protein [Vagococcus sp.]|uniref:BspA family leucine-rich repeat surface protein n=1 Tax=Vagococcus sp. TaxID=1933889 RepID=UPI003F9544A2